MKRILIVFQLLALGAAAQKTSLWRFDPGMEKAVEGYVKLGVGDAFDSEKGYGWQLQEQLEGYRGKSSKGVAADGISSSRPFYFSVKVPEGNYKVKLLLGGGKTSSSTFVRAECRRWMAGTINTKPGKTALVEFVVHVKDSLIRDESGSVIDKVKLKSRERNYLHWDDLLTLEFNGDAPQVASIEIERMEACVQVFLAGNSTVVDQDKEPWASWGQMIPRFFKPDKVVVANYAESGEALNSFKSAKRLQKILAAMKAGDYLFIEFGHNDQKQTGNGAGPWGNYKRLLEEYISETRKKGGIPVLVTSMHRRNFDSTGKVVNTLGEYPAAVRMVAKEQQVALIDLNEMSQALYEAWGEKNSVKAFVHYPANSFPGQPQALKDNTHFNTYGAWQLAKCVAKGIQHSGLPLAKELLENGNLFDPSHPDAFETWHWPLSPLVAVAKPDGN